MTIQLYDRDIREFLYLTTGECQDEDERVAQQDVEG